MRKKHLLTQDASRCFFTFLFPSLFNFLVLPARDVIVDGHLHVVLARQHGAVAVVAGCRGARVDIDSLAVPPVLEQQAELVVRKYLKRRAIVVEERVRLPVVEAQVAPLGQQPAGAGEVLREVLRPQAMAVVYVRRHLLAPDIVPHKHNRREFSRSHKLLSLGERVEKCALLEPLARAADHLGTLAALEGPAGEGKLPGSLELLAAEEVLPFVAQLDNAPRRVLVFEIKEVLGGHLLVEILFVTREVEDVLIVEALIRDHCVCVFVYVCGACVCVNDDAACWLFFSLFLSGVMGCRVKHRE